MIFFDTETCGLHSPVVFIQWARDDGDINLYSPWTSPIYETLSLIEEFCAEEDGVVGFNLAFDWFHLCQLYTTLAMYPDPSAYPIDVIEELALLEPEARFGPCLKPKTALDLMLYARKGPYQSTMDREDIRIKRVPSVLASKLAEELEKRIPLKDIYFARRKDGKADKWSIMDIEEDDGTILRDFKDIVLRFKPSSALKALAVDALGVNAEEVMRYTDIDCKVKTEELGYAPFALAVGKPGNWKGAWPETIRHHINHWTYNQRAREYAHLDVVYTRNLYKHFKCPDTGDDDSILACMVGAVRWQGFKIDVAKIKEQRKQALELLKKYPESLATAPHIARRYLEVHMDEIEKLSIVESTKKIIIESIAKWEKDDGSEHPAAKAAKDILQARLCKKEVELYEKLIEAGRFHASFKVIGTLSSRMAGADGLNPQGIKATTEVRSCFNLCDDLENYSLDGGDFDSFEVSIAEAEYNDPQLRADLLSGKKIHGLLAMDLFKKTYEEVLATKSTEDDLYHKGKTGVFALIYGGTERTISEKTGVSEQTGQEAFDNFQRRYPGVAESRKKTFDDFCSMRQPNGIGTMVEWHEPKDFAESMLGFRRYFHLENAICKALFELSSKPPKEWTQYKIKVVRRDREQTASGALRSALYACAFGIQAANMRAAQNHRIQSTGAQITKRLQRKIWDIQPAGVSIFLVKPLNVHDEVLNISHKSVKDKVRDVVNQTVKEYVPLIPFIAMKWKQDLTSWAGK